MPKVLDSYATSLSKEGTKITHTGLPMQVPPTNSPLQNFRVHILDSRLELTVPITPKGCGTWEPLTVSAQWPVFPSFDHQLWHVVTTPHHGIYVSNDGECDLWCHYALNKGFYSTPTAAAKAYNVAPRTVQRRDGFTNPTPHSILSKNKLYETISSD